MQSILRTDAVNLNESDMLAFAKEMQKRMFENRPLTPAEREQIGGARMARWADWVFETGAACDKAGILRPWL